MVCASVTGSPAGPAPTNPPPSAAAGPSKGRVPPWPGRSRATQRCPAAASARMSGAQSRPLPRNPWRNTNGCGGAATAWAAWEPGCAESEPGDPSAEVEAEVETEGAGVGAGEGAGRTS